MTDAEIRERAYAIVKRMKAAFTKDGCDWQREIETELRAVCGYSSTRSDKK